MPIRKLKFCPGNLYHLFNRGNAKQVIFNNDKDRYRFLQGLYISNNSNAKFGLTHLESHKAGFTLLEIKDIFEQKGINYEPFVKIYADCLMPNHYHLLVEEVREGGIVQFMQRSGNSYARYFTTKYKRPGSLFQGRFKAVQVETDDQLKYLLAYINIINPAQILEPKLKEVGIKSFDSIWNFADSYNWSTHQEFMQRRESILIHKSDILNEMFRNSDEYSEFVKDILRGKGRSLWSTINGLSLE